MMKMSTQHTPQAGDIWTVEENCGNWKCIWEHQNNQKIKVFMLWESGALELLGTGAFRTDCAGASTPARLIERDGLRGEELWQEWPWDDCPEYRREQVKKAWEDGYVVEVKSFQADWHPVSRNDDESFDSRVAPEVQYRITDRKRKGFSMPANTALGYRCACETSTPDPGNGLEFVRIEWHEDKEGCIERHGILLSMQECINQRDFAGWYYPQHGGSVDSECVSYVTKHEDYLSSVWVEGCEVVRPTHAAFVKEEGQ